MVLLNTICLYLLLFLCIIKAQGNQLVTTQFGETTVKIIYNSERGSNDTFIVVKYLPDVKELYLMKVNAEATVKSISCRQDSFKSIIYGAIGCTNPFEPEMSLVADNCLDSNIEVTRRRNIFREAFYLDKDSNECYLKGGAGDPRLCAGPLLLSKFPDYRGVPSALQLLDSSSVYIRTLGGRFAMIPTITEIDIQRPELLISVPVDASESCLAFNGSYGISSKLLYSKSDDVTLYMELKNVGAINGTSSGFDVHLSVLDSSGAYETVFKTVTPLASATNFALDTYLTVLLSSRDEYVLTTNDTLAENCTVVFSVTNNYDVPVIKDPYPLTSGNYSLNAIPSRFNRARFCNWHRGVYDATNLLKFPYCLDEEECGGDVSFVYSAENVDVPVYIPPDKTTSFRLNCEEFYAPNTTFLDYGGSLIYRDNFFSSGCNAPFLIPELIDAPKRLYEKYIQCQKRGGLVAKRSATHCTRSITDEYCQTGWIYLDQYCYYRFDSVSELSYNTDPEPCVNLFALSEKVQSIDVYLKAFMEKEFVFWKFNPERPIIYRVNVNSDFCLCFSADAQEGYRCSCFEYEIDGVLIFPVCRYSIQQPGVLPKYFNIGMSLGTATVLKNGQDGPKHSGHPAKCVCKDGWCGRNCEVPCCRVSDLVTSNPSDISRVLSYFQACSANGGRCYEDNPRDCVCPVGKGPSSSLLPDLPGLHQYEDYPCPCPANTKTFGTFQIDDNFFFEQTVYSVPCSGVMHGICTVNNGTYIGTCTCKTRTLNGVTEDAYIARDCGAPVAIEPFKGDVKNGPINKEDICNGNGVSCPHGQSVLNPEGNIDDPRCYGKEDGCICDNGWGGPSCTNPVPFNYARDKFLQLLEEEYGTIDLTARQEINFINVTGDNCAVNRVTISNNQQDVVECIYNENIELYRCSRGQSAYQYINVFPEDALDIDSIYGCDINAFTDRFVLCGLESTTNPFAGRFLENANFRNKDFYLYAQQFNVSKYGAYNGECMCGPNNDGAQCKDGVSSIREDTKRVCGEEILPSRGYLCEDGCCCNGISSVDVSGRIGPTQERYSGEACEIVEAYNIDLDEVIPCAGHGSPQAINIPYGSCAVDLDKYEADALSEPFSVSVEDVESLSGIHTVTSKSYLKSSSTNVMYEANVGNVLTINNLKNSLAFEYSPDSIRLRGVTISEPILPILWSNYVYQENGITKTIDYDCNPGLQAMPPGRTDTPVCPYIDMCDGSSTNFPTTSPTKNPTSSPVPPTLNPTTNPTTSPIPPTANPTTNPTENPSLSPTKFPTTGFPTNFPTPLISPTMSPGNPDLLVYSAGTQRGNFSLLDVCDSASIPTGDRYTCDGETIPFFSNSTFDLKDIGSFFGLSTPHNIISPLGTVICDYDDFMSAGATCTNPFINAGVDCNLWWSGSTTTGEVSSYTCNDWTDGSVAASGMIGICYEIDNSGFMKNIGGLEPTGLDCHGNFVFNGEQLQPLASTLCACKAMVSPITDFPTANPTTANPTGFPTAFPTTTPEERTNKIGCVESFNVVYDNSLPSIDAGTYTDLELREGFSISDDDTFDITFGSIACNNFVDRTINCALIWLGFSDYCPDEPIGCFDNSVGFAFGGFYEQHPSIKYTVDREDWTLNHYKGIGSILNGYKYVRREVLTPQLLVEYIKTWVSGDFATLNRTITPVDTFYQTDLIQARNDINLNTNHLAKLTTQEKQCQFGILSSCRGLNYRNNTNLFTTKPGLQVLFNASNVITLTITPNHEVRYTALEIVDEFNNILAQDLNPSNITVTYPILATNASFFSVRYIGLESIYDGPEQYYEPPKVHDNSYDYVYANYLGDGLENTTFLFNEPDTSFNLFAANAIELDGVYPIPFGFKHKPFENIDYIDDVIDNVVYSIEYSADTNPNGGSSGNAWVNITNNIIESNTYPYNQPLADIITSDKMLLDYNSAADLKYLYDVWTVWLAPRFCSTDTQCKTFELGECIRPTDTVNIGWLQGDPDIDESPVGIEGGCLCYDDFELGFYELSNACQTCVDGYGPNSLDDFYDVIQYSDLISKTFDPTDPVFDPEQGYDTFVDQLSCRLPFGVDPIVSSFKDYNLCAGHGQVEILPEVTYDSTITANDVIPACNKIWLNNITYNLNDKYSDPRTLIYSNDTKIVSIIDNTVYLNGEIVIFEDCAQESPLLCSTNIGEFFCVNNDLYDEDGKNIAISYVLDDEILRLYSIDKFHYRFLASKKVVPTFTPTASPTSFPTPFPSSSPTEFPTESPTPRTGNPIILFNTPARYLGNAIGDFATSQAICVAANPGLTCTSLIPFLGYSVDLPDFPATYGFSGDDSAIKNSTGAVMSYSWNTAINGTSSMLNGNLGDYIDTTFTYWTGFDTTGDVSSDNCNDWVDAVSATGGYTLASDEQWFAVGILGGGCTGVTREFLCICLT